jgi:hypothetical protein
LSCRWTSHHLTRHPSWFTESFGAPELKDAKALLMSILLTLQQSLEEPLGSVGIAPGLDEDIEHNAILIDGAPEILQHALDPNEHLVRVPLVSWSWPAASPAIGESRAEFHAPASHRVVGDDDAALSQDQLYIARNRRMRTRPIQAIKAAASSCLTPM